MPQDEAYPLQAGAPLSPDHQIRLDLLKAAGARVGHVVVGPDNPDQILGLLGAWHRYVGGAGLHVSEEAMLVEGVRQRTVDSETLHGFLGKVAASLADDPPFGSFAIGPTQRSSEASTGQAAPGPLEDLPRGFFYTSEQIGHRLEPQEYAAVHALFLERHDIPANVPHAKITFALNRLGVANRPLHSAELEAFCIVLLDRLKHSGQLAIMKHEGVKTCDMIARGFFSDDATDIGRQMSAAGFGRIHAMQIHHRLEVLNRVIADIPADERKAIVQTIFNIRRTIVSVSESATTSALSPRQLSAHDETEPTRYFSSAEVRAARADVQDILRTHQERDGHLPNSFDAHDRCLSLFREIYGNQASTISRATAMRHLRGLLDTYAEHRLSHEPRRSDLIGHVSGQAQRIFLYADGLSLPEATARQIDTHITGGYSRFKEVRERFVAIAQAAREVGKLSPLPQEPVPSLVSGRRAISMNNGSALAELRDTPPLPERLGELLGDFATAEQIQRLAQYPRARVALFTLLGQAHILRRMTSNDYSAVSPDSPETAWAARYVVGNTLTEIAETAGVSRTAVRGGIRDWRKTLLELGRPRLQRVAAYAVSWDNSVY